MKDMLGVTVEVGDVIVSASGQGRHKIGRVYSFNADGLPMIETCEKEYNRDSKTMEYAWRKVSSGWSVLIIGRESLGEMGPTPEAWNKIRMEYPSASRLG
jgi:hypothetical protein